MTSCWLLSAEIFFFFTSIHPFLNWIDLSLMFYLINLFYHLVTQIYALCHTLISKTSSKGWNALSQMWSLEWAYEIKWLHEDILFYPRSIISLTNTDQSGTINIPLTSSVLNLTALTRMIPLNLWTAIVIWLIQLFIKSVSPDNTLMFRKQKYWFFNCSFQN